VTAVDASRVTDAVVALLRAESGLLVGDGTPPTPETASDTLSLRTGYLLVYQVPVGMAYESEGLGGQSEAMTRCRYQVNAVGIQRNQAERMAERAVKILVDRTAGTYTHALTVTGHDVLERCRAGQVPLDASDGTFVAGGLVDVVVNVSA